MGKYVIDENTLKSIAEKLRFEFLEVLPSGETKITPEQMPDVISNGVGYVYSRGVESGVEQGKYEGKQEAYDAFWDIFQNNGKRTEYYAGFAGAGWTTETFKPKYDIKPSGNAYGMFQKSRIAVDLVEFAQQQGIEIDFSNITEAQYGFANTSFTRLGVISVNSNLIRGFEINPALKIIDKIVLRNPVATSLSNAFNQCPALEEIRFEGNIVGSVSFSVCPLSKESILSIITHLSGTSSSQTLTLKSSAVGAIDWSNTVIDDVTYNTFDEICDLKPNWTISLV